MKSLIHDTIICVDLRPFNPKEKDYGVSEYFSKIGFRPTVIVFLNFFVDFLHQHEAVDDTFLNKMSVGQRGTPSKYPWTKRDLFNLISEIKKQGVRPVLGILSSTRSDVWKDAKIDWKFDEILQTKQGGQNLWGGSINPLKRFKDGRFYEDLFIECLAKVLRDYNFEGYVAGDGMLGLRGPRETLADTDFSNDMVEQFREYSGVSIPPNLEDYDARADYIVTNYFSLWVDFYVYRWGVHVEKVSKALKAENKCFMAIDSWSRNPEEIKTSFGIDYRLLCEKGLEAVFVQARETNKWRKHREGGYVREENSVYTFLTHKAYEPRLKYYWAEAAINVPEFWNSVLDLPHVLERETFGYLWTVNARDGKFLKTTEGICVIWGNDLTQDQWKWLVQCWDKAYRLLSEFKEPIGLTLIWNEKGINEVQAENKKYGYWFADLLNHGLCIQSTIHENELANLSKTDKALFDKLFFISFDTSITARYPGISDRIFIVSEDNIRSGGFNYSWQEGVERMKEASGLRSSKGRVFGFRNVRDEYIISLENANNLFYEHIELEVPEKIGEVKVLPPREWFAIPDTVDGNSTKVSVAPDASTQVIVFKRNGEKE